MKKKKFFTLFKHTYNLIDMLYFILYSDKEYFDETRNNLALQDCNDEKFPIPKDYFSYFSLSIFSNLENTGARVRVKYELMDDGRIFFYLQTSKDLDDFINCGGLYNFGQEIFKGAKLEEDVEYMKKEYGAPIPNTIFVNLLNEI